MMSSKKDLFVFRRPPRKHAPPYASALPSTPLVSEQIVHDKRFEGTFKALKRWDLAPERVGFCPDQSIAPSRRRGPEPDRWPEF
jgi:hypothetical protein